MLILHVPKQKLEQSASGWLAKIKQLDPLGNLVFFPGVVCLVLALQWGGTTYSWQNARIIVLLVLCFILIAAFIGVQIWKGDAGTVPPRIIRQRSIAASIWFTFFNGAGMMVVMYYLPIWFQAIKGVSAVKSGIMLLPTVLSVVIGAISSGIIISKTGYYSPFFLISSILMPVGAGLLSTFTINTGAAKWIGYQILFGISLGFGSQQPINVVQTVLARIDVSTGTAIIFFIRFLGAAIFVPVAENIFLNQLVKKLQNLPGISTEAITNGGATELRSLASGADLNTLLIDYNAAIMDVFYMCTATSAITIFGAVLVEWKSLKEAAKAEQMMTKHVDEAKSSESLRETAEDIEKEEV
jgi:hypothetical protein